MLVFGQNSGNWTGFGFRYLQVRDFVMVCVPRNL